MKRRLFLTLAFILSLAVHAQIGYQVSLLNSKTGEPHVNETVSVKIEITDSEGSIPTSTPKTFFNKFSARFRPSILATY